MKAIRVTVHGGPEVLKIEDVPMPEPAAGQVRIRVRAAGVNPVDTYIRSGAYTNSEVPYVPGFDAAGEIEKVGPGVKDFRLGDRVYTSDTESGAYAEYTVAAVEAVHRLPSNISFVQGAGLGIPYATAYRGLFQKARIIAGETVLVHGASGGVGLAAVQLARAAGATVIGTAGTESGRKSVQENGAHHVLDHSAANFNDELMRLTTNRGVDVILEMLANVNLARDLTFVAKHGRVVIIGSRGKIEINPRDAMARESVIYGLMLFNASPGEIQSIHAGLYAGLENGTLRPIVGKEFPLVEAPAAHKAVMEPGAHGKIVLIP